MTHVGLMADLSHKIVLWNLPQIFYTKSLLPIGWKGQKWQWCECRIIDIISCILEHNKKQTKAECYLWHHSVVKVLQKICQTFSLRSTTIARHRLWKMQNMINFFWHSRTTDSCTLILAKNECLLETSFLI